MMDITISIINSESGEDMSKTNKILIAVIAVLVIVGGIWAVLAMMNKPADTSKNQSSNEQKSSDQTNTNTNTTVAATITYTDSGFEPATVTVKSGSKIKIVNGSQAEIEIASDPHPTHTNNPELNTEDIEPGATATITVTTVGTWGYHNHYSPTKKGSLIVE